MPEKAYHVFGTQFGIVCSSKTDDFFLPFLCRYVSSFIRIYPTYLLPPNGRNSSLSLSKKGDTLGLVAFLLYRNLLPSKSAYKVQILQKFPKLGAFVTRQREFTLFLTTEK